MSGTSRPQQRFVHGHSAAIHSTEEMQERRDHERRHEDRRHHEENGNGNNGQ